MAKFTRPDSLVDRATHYCPGCLHGIVHRLIAEVIDELDIEGKTIGVWPVGCGVFGYWYFGCDNVSASHGRAPAAATGVKRAKPDRVVFSYQGDGDMMAIGTAEAIHAANRGENITSIFINNAIYGMTGGQMAPTTLPGQKTQTSPFGRDTETAGFPFKTAELFAKLDGVALSARVSVHDPKHIREAKAVLKKAFESQMRGEGYSMIEVLTNCPTNWGMTATNSIKWLEENMLPYYPTGIYKEGSVR
jgi:2-oxoglutarate ferredoxin oxidoreductase subunit beta